MIGLTFQGQFGNQLFQYAAVRIQAERLKCGLVIDAPAGKRAALANLLHQRFRQEIFQCFPTLRVHAVSHWLAVLKSVSRVGYSITREKLFPFEFQPEQRAPDGNEAYDHRIWRSQNGTWFKGFYQSEKYFAGWEQEVRSWYRTPIAISRQVGELVARLPDPIDNMIAVHIRLGDYLSQSGAHAEAHRGWALPKDYYERALAVFPSQASIALFSDDPDHAANLLPRAPAWVARTNSAALDLFLLSSFPRVVIANSSFSWWAAWLNQRSDKVVVGPMYHLGWRERRWYPADVRVEGWIYV